MSFFKKLFSSKEQVHKNPEILLEARSPSCPITAIVEQDARVAYFYLWGPENSNFGVRSCWIRNLIQAPERVEKGQMEKGFPPMLVKEYCRFPEGQERLNKRDLTIIWLEEGDGAALLLKDEIISIIPSWSGMGGFFGYARDCKDQGDFAWEISEDNVMIERIHESKKFYDSWTHELNPFNIQQPVILAVYEEMFGKGDKYYAIDGNEWPPKGLFRRKGESKTVFATVGLSLLPMPVVEMHTENRFDMNRIELGIMVDSTFSENDIQQIAEWISGQAGIPWNNITFLGEGHTINFKPFNSKKFNSVVLTNRLDVLPKPQLDNYRNSRINFLWMVPVSEKERNEIIKNGSDEILTKLNELGEQIYSLNRAEVV